jgi:hypothetical protein
MSLTIPQRQKLHAALVSAFPGPDELDLLTQLYLGLPISHMTPVAALPVMVLKLITWAEAHGRILELVEGARNATRNNGELLEFCALYHLDATQPPPLSSSPIGRAHDAAPPRPELERVVIQAVEFAHVERWRARMEACERTVCRVELPLNQGVGTGFLIAHDMVMTSYHVIKPLIEGRGNWAHLHFRFGYRIDATGTTVYEGQTYAALPKLESALVMSDGVDGLDYAIVQLAEPAGMRTVDGKSGAPIRGYLAWHPYELTSGEPIFIIQHPLAAPLRVTSGAFLDETPGRIYYQANTLAGSSGAPCFTSDWKLVALHRSGDERGNEGVLLAAIAADIEQASGLRDALLTKATA